MSQVSDTSGELPDGGELEPHVERSPRTQNSGLQEVPLQGKQAESASEPSSQLPSPSSLHVNPDIKELQKQFVALHSQAINDAQSIRLIRSSLVSELSATVAAREKAQAAATASLAASLDAEKCLAATQSTKELLDQQLALVSVARIKLEEEVNATRQEREQAERERRELIERQIAVGEDSDDARGLLAMLRLELAAVSEDRDKFASSFLEQKQAWDQQQKQWSEQHESLKLLMRQARRRLDGSTRKFSEERAGVAMQCPTAANTIVAKARLRLEGSQPDKAEVSPTNGSALQLPDPDLTLPLPAAQRSRSRTPPLPSRSRSRSPMARASSGSLSDSPSMTPPPVMTVEECAGCCDDAACGGEGPVIIGRSHSPSPPSSPRSNGDPVDRDSKGLRSAFRKGTVKFSTLFRREQSA